eukprot:4159119-Prymnesium_polylepis.1
MEYMYKHAGQPTTMRRHGRNFRPLLWTKQPEPAAAAGVKRFGLATGGDGSGDGSSDSSDACCTLGGRCACHPEGTGRVNRGKAVQIVPE